MSQLTTSTDEISGVLVSRDADPSVSINIHYFMYVHLTGNSNNNRWGIYFLEEKKSGGNGPK